MMSLFANLKLNTIRKKMMVYFILITLMIGFISIYMSFNARMLLNEIDEMFKMSLILNDIDQQLNVTHKALTTYVETKSSDSLNEYIESSENLTYSTIQLIQEYDQIKGILSVENINNLVIKYNQYSADAVVAKRGRDIDRCRESYQSAQETMTNIQKIIDDLKLLRLDQSVLNYKSLAEYGKNVQNYNMIMIVNIIILTICMVLSVTYKMTKPIIKLSQAANEIAKGDFEGETIIVQSEDEIQIMAKAFNKMRTSIKNSIEELRKTNEMESKLFEKELQTVKMQALLNDAEFRALQSQINPHFLFNSLNAGVQLAMMEEADLTLQFLENMAAIFRYNIKPLDEEIIVEEELNNIRAYCELMKVRFGNKMEFEMHIDENVLPVPIMPLILQPIVENAFIHGIGKSEKCGRVIISAFVRDGKVVFTVNDTGVGMSQEKIKRVMCKDISGKSQLITQKKNHSSGIGAGNVLQRLRLFYGGEESVAIESKENIGTEITIQLPIG